MDMQDNAKEIGKQLEIVVGLIRTIEPAHRQALEQIAEEYGDDALDMTLDELINEMEDRSGEAALDRCKAALERYKAAYERYKDL